MLILDYKNEKPLHEQIFSGIKALIINGNLLPEEKLPSVRELSVELTVNPNTVQRAYRDLEAEGMIFSIRGKGNFVSKECKVSNEKTQALYHMIETSVKELAYLGEDKEKILSAVSEFYPERND